MSAFLTQAQRSMQLWVNGVGSFLLAPASSFLIGAAGDRPEGPGLRLLANLHRDHASIHHQGEGYLLRPNGTTAVDGVPIVEPVWLQNGQELQFEESVRIRFRRPTSLSGSACLDFLSDHRPMRRLDGVVLMTEFCLLGPRPHCHIQCPQWEGDVVLMREKDGLGCRSSQQLELIDQPGRQANQIPERTPVVGGEQQFHWEWYHA